MVAQVEVTPRSGYRTAFKILIAISAVAVLVQAVTAGQVLGGAMSSAGHAAGAGAVHLSQVLAFIAAILVWKPGRGPGWLPVAAGVVMVLGFAQSAIGSGLTSLHVPLGMLLFGLTVWLSLWAWRRG